jgi:hypothetical protein
MLYRPLPGHGRINARALESAGRAAYARSAHDLIELISGLEGRRDDSGKRSPPAQPLCSGDVITAVLGMCESRPGRRAS